MRIQLKRSNSSTSSNATKPNISNLFAHEVQLINVTILSMLDSVSVEQGGCGVVLSLGGLILASVRWGRDPLFLPPPNPTKVHRPFRLPIPHNPKEHNQYLEIFDLV
jgi:hypothetical protein